MLTYTLIHYTSVKNYSCAIKLHIVYVGHVVAPLTGNPVFYCLLQMPKLTFRSNAKPSLYAYPPPLEEEKKKEREKVTYSYSCKHCERVTFATSWEG